VRHEDEVNKFNVSQTHIEAVLKNYGLLPLRTTNFDTKNKKLLFASVVRWDTQRLTTFLYQFVRWSSHLMICHHYFTF